MIHGRMFDEPMLFTLAYAYEQATHHRRPSPLFPECTDPSYTPLSDVVDASTNASKLKAEVQKGQLTGQALGMSQHTDYNWRLDN